MTTLTPTSARAKNRLREHTLIIERTGVFQNAPAVLTRCTDTDCPNIARDGAPWTGWLTDTEMNVVDPRRDG